MSEQKSYELRDGTVLSIAPLTQSRILSTVRGLRKKGIVVSMDDSKFESSIEFQLALGQTLLVGLRKKELDGTMKEQGDLEKRLFLEETPGALNYVLSKASEQAKEAAAQFEDQLGNS